MDELREALRGEKDEEKKRKLEKECLKRGKYGGCRENCHNRSRVAGDLHYACVECRIANGTSFCDILQRCSDCRHSSIVCVKRILEARNRVLRKRKSAEEEKEHRDDKELIRQLTREKRALYKQINELEENLKIAQRQIKKNKARSLSSEKDKAKKCRARSSSPRKEKVKKGKGKGKSSKNVEKEQGEGDTSPKEVAPPLQELSPKPEGRRKKATPKRMRSPSPTLTDTESLNGITNEREIANGREDIIEISNGDSTNEVVREEKEMERE